MPLAPSMAQPRSPAEDSDRDQSAPAHIIDAARRAYPIYRRRRQCSYRDFESGYIARWREEQER